MANVGKSIKDILNSDNLALVVKGMGGTTFAMKSDGEIVEIISMGNLRKKYQVLIGDIVKIEKDKYSDKYVATDIVERKNRLIRPSISNLDQLFILVSPRPAPDMLLVDKLIIKCNLAKIKPILVVNKSDIMDAKEIENLKSQFYFVDTYVVSAKTGDGVQQIKELLHGNISAFAGQSAVGKSTLLNAIVPSLMLSTGGLSKKTDRGTHTTRHSEIFVIGDIFIADTPGFSLYDLSEDIDDPNELWKYYPDFEVATKYCRYGGCTHINCTSDDCGVVDAVEQGDLNPQRYERYTELYKNLKFSWDSRYSSKYIGVNYGKNKSKYKSTERK